MCWRDMKAKGYKLDLTTIIQQNNESPQYRGRIIDTSYIKTSLVYKYCHLVETPPISCLQVLYRWIFILYQGLQKEIWKKINWKNMVKLEKLIFSFNFHQVNTWHFIQHLANCSHTITFPIQNKKIVCVV